MLLQFLLRADVRPKIQTQRSCLLIEGLMIHSPNSPKEKAEKSGFSGGISFKEIALLHRSSLTELR